MPVRLYVLLTWTTHRRLPLLNSAAAAFLRRFLPVEARRHGARVIDLGIVRNHVHALLELPPVVDIPLEHELAARKSIVRAAASRRSMRSLWSGPHEVYSVAAPVAKRTDPGIFVPTLEAWAR